MDKFLSILKPDEVLNLKLRYLYEQAGYKKYRMSSFEEYRFYLENQNFLLSNSVITFTDLDGRLLALKPDVTLSIVKQADDSELKVYYNENVYRPDRNKRSFKEIAQTGLERIGKLDVNDLTEVVILAAKSLKIVSDRSLLEIGHCGFVNGLLRVICEDVTLIPKLEFLISQKNIADIQALCKASNISELYIDMLLKLIGLSGSFDDILPIAKKLCLTGEMKEALDELIKVYSAAIAADGCCDVKVDLSLVGEEEYYNGITFCGYVDGASTRVLSGGRYDALLKKLGKASGAIGFALYFDELEQFYYNNAEAE